MSHLLCLAQDRVFGTQLGALTVVDITQLCLNMLLIFFKYFGLSVCSDTVTDVVSLCNK